MLARTVTSSRPPVTLPEEIRNELCAVNARLWSEFEGTNGRKYQFWICESWVQCLLIEIHPPDGLFVWQPLAGGTNLISATAEKLRAHLTSAA